MRSYDDWKTTEPGWDSEDDLEAQRRAWAEDDWREGRTCGLRGELEEPLTDEDWDEWDSGE